jgi:hypothetical protein
MFANNIVIFVHHYCCTVLIISLNRTVLVHDKVLKICPGTGTSTGTVTLKLTQGFSFGRPVLYLSLDSRNPLAATLEDVTYSVRLGDIVTGHDDSFGSATERLFALANGPTG